MTTLQDAYVFDTGAIVPPWVYDSTVAVPVIAGYSQPSRPLRFVRSHRAPGHPLWEWLANKADPIAALVIAFVHVVVPGVLPIFF